MLRRRLVHRRSRVAGRALAVQHRRSAPPFIAAVNYHRSLPPFMSPFSTTVSVAGPITVAGLSARRPLSHVLAAHPHRLRPSSG
eukprot:2531164-Prymnesium_polylepis.1